MSFHLSESQRMLQDAASRFMRQRHPISALRSGEFHGAGHGALWQEIAEQGWPALLATTDQGGLELGVQEAWLVAMEAGRHLLSLPLVANMVVLPTLCAQSQGQLGVAQTWLSNVLSGAVCYGVATLRPDGSVFVEGAVAGGQALAFQHQAANLVRLSLYSIKEGIAGLDPSLRVTRLVNQAPGTVLDLQVDDAIWRVLQQRIRLLRVAEMLGAASQALDLAATYARERMQFGRAIGANQAIKHRLAENWMVLDDACLAGTAAAQALDQDSPEAQQACHYAQLLAVEASRRAAQQAVQTHGALGITWECDVQLYLKRILHVAATLEAETSTASLLEKIWEDQGLNSDPVATVSTLCT